MSSNFLRIGIVQPSPLSNSYEEFSKGGDVKHACELLGKFKNEVDIVCFPELYPRTGEKEISKKIKELRIYAIAGLIEETDKSLYNTATLFGRSGIIIGRQRKKYPTIGEIEKAGIISGKDYHVFNVDKAKIGMVICADFPFFSDWNILIERKVDVIFNPSRWFALSDAYPSTVISRHLEFGIPIIGINWAKFSFPGWRETPDGFPPAGGHSTITFPPKVTNLKGLGDWFRTKPYGIDSSEDFAIVLGEKEETAIISIDIEAVRNFPGYFYYEEHGG